MNNIKDLATIEDRLRDLRRVRDQLFVSQIELRINLEILSERQEALIVRSQYLAGISAFLASEKF